jgi:hypothetical protein
MITRPNNKKKDKESIITLLQTPKLFTFSSPNNPHLLVSSWVVPYLVPTLVFHPKLLIQSEKEF